MVLWISAQNNFYVILDSYAERHAQKNSSLNFMSQAGFQVSKIWMLFWKNFWGASLEIILYRNSSIEFSFFLFSNSFAHDLKESRELRDLLIRWILGEAFKNARNVCWQFLFFFFCVFELPLWIYELLWNTKFCFLRYLT